MIAKPIITLILAAAILVGASGTVGSLYFVSSQGQTTTLATTSQPVITLSDIEASPGSVIDVQGSNFGANSQVSIYFMSAEQTDLTNGTAFVLQGIPGNQSATTQPEGDLTFSDTDDNVLNALEGLLGSSPDQVGNATTTTTAILEHNVLVVLEGAGPVNGTMSLECEDESTAEGLMNGTIGTFAVSPGTYDECSISISDGNITDTGEIDDLIVVSDSEEDFDNSLVRSTIANEQGTFASSVIVPSVEEEGEYAILAISDDRRAAISEVSMTIAEPAEPITEPPDTSANATEEVVNETISQAAPQEVGGEEATPELPTVEIISNSTEGVAPATFEFEANITGGTEPYTISWDFGDGAEDTDIDSNITTHTFATPGLYNVTVDVVDSLNNTGSASTLVDVAEQIVVVEQPTNPLIVEIISNSTEGVAPATFEFEANITGGTEPYTISWDFDDDSEESDEETVLHTFEEAGTYNVNLTATDSEDQTAYDSIEINVEEAGAADEEAPEAGAADEEAPEAGAADEEAPEAGAADEEAPEAGAADEEAAAVADLRQTAASEGATDMQELADTSGIDLGQVADSAGLSLEELEDLLFPQPNATDPDPPAEEPPAEEPPAEEPPAEEPPAEQPTPGQGGQDRFGVDQIYPTAQNGPVWYIKERQDPTSDGYFYYGMYRTTTVEYSGNGVWRVDARTGTEEHGIRMHVDSPSGKWVNTEITGYFRVLTGSDQITMIARHGPSYHDDGGCQAYGYYGMTAVDGEVFFKKKLYHYDGGYTRRLAQIDALDNLIDNWVGMKFVVYDIGNGDVKLELWIDEGDMTNNWNKVTELVDDGGLHVEGGDDCGRQSDHIIKEGTRSSFRVDDSLFEYKKLSVREIQ
jgi:PKD repeat protein